MCRFNRSHLFFAIRTNKRLQYMNAFRFLIFANDTNLPAVSLILHFIHLPFSIILPFFSLFIRKQNILPLWIIFALCNRSDKAYLRWTFNSERNWATKGHHFFKPQRFNPKNCAASICFFGTEFKPSRTICCHCC